MAEKGKVYRCELCGNIVSVLHQGEGTLVCCGQNMTKLDEKSMTHPSCHPSRRLDYVLTSDKVKVKSYKVLKYDFSDHLPLMVDFDVV